MSEINRREFVVVTVGATVALSGAVDWCGGAANEERSSDAASVGPTRVDVGTVADYSADGITDTFAKSNKLFVVRKANRLYAPSAICTHKHCGLKLRDGAIACPCHRSKFADDGTNAGGPARAPLARYAIAINADGRIIVDKSRTFDQPEWDSADAFVAL